MSQGSALLRLALVVALSVYCTALPVPEANPNLAEDLDSRPEIIEIIAPAQTAQETLDSLNLGDPNSEQSERNKRTIGILRQLFPNLSQIIDQKVQQIVSYLFRTVGRSLLAGALGGGNSGSSSGSSSSSDDKVSISLPTFNDDDSEEEDEDDDDKSSEKSAELNNRFGGDDEDSSAANEATAAVNGDDENQLGAESQQSEVRVQFTDPDGDKKAEDKSSDVDPDQEGAASDSELSLDDVDASDENRNKRFLSFGFGDSSAAASGGSGGGSGNFLFDIIRRPAESMARAAGQAFRILTGTDSIGLGITATHTAVRDIPNLNNATKLVAGSGGTEQSDEAQNAPVDGDVGKGDGLTEGIPGPVTRLFIIANRGISNLIQDLILRLAQTSERIVNFKARLITSII